MLTYRQQPPPAQLAPWVECLWTLEGVAPAGRETILPDGRMEIVCHHGSRPQGQVARFVTGQITSPLHLYPTGRLHTTGIRLRPAAAGAYLRAPASEFTGHFADWVAKQPAALPDEAVAHAVTLIERSAGSIRMDRLTGVVNLSPRQFDRSFLAAVGLPPKSFARIVRFQAVLAAYRDENYPRWATLALQCGFYDQAHLANEFRQFAGQPPVEFFRDPSALAVLMANLSKTPPLAKPYHRDLCDF